MEVSGRKEDLAQPQSDASKNANQIYCDPCQHDGHQLPADGYCVDCREYLCSACYSIHRRPAVWRHHQLLDAQAMPKIKPATKVKDTCTDVCQKHTEKIIEYFCNEHETFGCSACMTTGHRACIKVDYIPEVAVTYDTSTELTETQEYLLELFKMNENNKSDTLSKSKAVDLHAKRAKAQIMKLRTEVITLFERLEKDIDKSVDDIKSRDEAKMTKLANETEIISNDLQNYISEIETKVNERKICQLFIATKCMKESIDKIAQEIKRVAENESIQRYVFEPDQVIVDMKQKLKGIGTLKCLDTHAKVAEFEGEVNVKAADDNNECNITGMTLLSENKQLVVADTRNRAVKLLDVEQKQFTSIYKTGDIVLKQPFDVAEVEHRQIAVSYPSARAIEFLTISESGSFKFDRAINATGQCHGITCIGSNLVVSFNNPSVVKILTTNGRVIKMIEGNFEYPDYIAVNPVRDTIYISNGSGFSGSVTCVTNEGKVNTATEGDHLGRPHGIIVDKTGSVLACCQFKDSILQLSEDCEVTTELLNKSDGIRNPKCIAKSKQDTLYIGMDGDRISMFKLY
ncbi:uncharacterized protein LOC123526681 [Mercenaria mercenaria]|uniref:uncharacterized protein LOC123526681 n=1 Tax=Mercenaria mercenaria TaxID=6596 RepID=UPI00234E49DF|nr:uncharacterized protein LOC123526681 [Mercenaria mercenaria]